MSYTMFLISVLLLGYVGKEYKITGSSYLLCLLLESKKFSQLSSSSLVSSSNSFKESSFFNQDGSLKEPETICKSSTLTDVCIPTQRQILNKSVKSSHLIIAGRLFPSMLPAQGQSGPQTLEMTGTSRAVSQ